VLLGQPVVFFQDIAEAVDTPPQTTRARLRGEFILYALVVAAVF
jgi:hypothetical protein